MSYYSKLNIIYRLQKWMDSVPGQTFLNYAYSWGASIVILGTLFKLTHLPGANIMLFLGMGTEVLVFFFSAFDRPFDKTADGRDIPVHVNDEDISLDEVETAENDANIVSNIGRQKPASNPAGSWQKQESVPAVEHVTENQTVNAQSTAMNAPQNAQPVYVPQVSAEEAAELSEVQSNYIAELNTLIETLSKVNEQSTRLTRDSEEMENLNRTLTGISKVYEMQLKGASQQIGTIDQINDQTRKMAKQIEQLNAIYARMIQAMTVNMNASVPNVVPNNVEE